ncbi:MAG: multidrug transporter subunit MdtA, partial [Stenotrophomonas maltophilia]
MRMSASTPASSRRRFAKPLLIAAAVGLVAIAAWKLLSPAPAAGPAGGPQPTPVRVATATQEDLVVRLKALGTVT